MGIERIRIEVGAEDGMEPYLHSQTGGERGSTAQYLLQNCPSPLALKRRRDSQSCRSTTGGVEAPSPPMAWGAVTDSSSAAIPGRRDARPGPVRCLRRGGGGGGWKLAMVSWRRWKVMARGALDVEVERGGIVDPAGGARRRAKKAGVGAPRSTPTQELAPTYALTCPPQQWTCRRW